MNMSRILNQKILSSYSPASLPGQQGCPVFQVMDLPSGTFPWKTSKGGLSNQFLMSKSPQVSCFHGKAVALSMAQMADPHHTFAHHPFIQPSNCKGRQNTIRN
ncbi:hypothetical protein XENOCAPTIV_017579 [Xenoophorus captivus]|uniref:Uncharacterized protein n=1 Tax=Xenoophorus captivus TaxID=1517983 RepID=A0ABV0QIR4_9TELE